jgi:hypothetical protein
MKQLRLTGKGLSRCDGYFVDRSNASDNHKFRARMARSASSQHMNYDTNQPAKHYQPGGVEFDAGQRNHGS